MRSDKVKKGILRAPHRSLLYALGLEKEDLDKPFIGIVNSYNETVPGHKHLRSVVENIKEGIYKNGGIPFEFNTIAICDGLAMNHEGMSYSFVSRNLICDSIIVQSKGFPFDGLVFVPNCDKVVPGMLMAAAQLNLPSIFVSGGPMLSKKMNGTNKTLTSVFEATGAYQNGDLSSEQLEEIEKMACPTCGSCSGMYTANTMNCLCEVLGIALAGNGTIPAVYSERNRLYKKVGRLSVDLVNNDVKFRDIVKKENYENAIVADMAMSGSTNTILHLLAVAKSSDIQLTLTDFSNKSKMTPQLVKLSPASDYTIQDFDEAGGMMALLKELGSSYLKDTKTLTSDSLFKQIAEYTNKNKEVIHSVKDAYFKAGGLSILKGNLASQGAVVKSGAVKDKMRNFTGKALVFENEQQCVNYLEEFRIQEDNENRVLVIRNMGIKSGNGIPEMLTPTSLIKGKKMSEFTALVTDGRFSGGSNGLVVGHVSPEAAEDGLIAYVENDDLITINIDEEKLTLNVEDKIIKKRKANIKFNKTNDYLEYFSDNALNSSKGGVYNGWFS
ncbi:dihydroxy-acid dehydratase [Mycoplasma sp. P36-A1]|uniref:dihydroxy-acid dehydratase n=1 Tax=Mycoplasma sp. P36-A1 TaxID=3252900 RepID=UPI003C300D91